MDVINQKEYLKKYLSGGEKDKKKKRKKKINSCERVKIIDDDIDLSKISSAETAEDLFGTNEDAPQIVGVIDDRPMHLRVDDYRQSDFWRPLGAASTSDDAEANFKGSMFQKEKEILLKLIKKESGKDFKSISLRKLHKSKSNLDKDNEDSPVTRWNLSNKEWNESTDFNKNGEDHNVPKKPDLDTSPPCKLESLTDNSPPRRQRRISSGSEVTPSTPPHIAHDIDISPPRKSRWSSDNSSSKTKKRDYNQRKHYNQTDRKRQHQEPHSNRDITKRKLLPGDKKGKYLIPAKRMTKTLDGKMAGLQSAQELIKENEAFRKREDTLFQSMSAEISGVNAATVLRDKRTGKIRDIEKEAQERLEKQKQEQVNKEKYSRWGKGLKQVEEYENKLQQDLLEMNKPLARYADDEDLERYLRDQEREGDPMLDYIRKKRRKKDVEMGKPMKPKFEGEFMPNRFGIPPGHRWDGVDRSNGYEKKWIDVQNAKHAIQEEIYKWSTEDM